MWAVRLELASVRLVEVNKKRKNEADLGFLGVLTFSFFMRKNPWNQTRGENEKGAPAL